MPHCRHPRNDLKASMSVFISSADGVVGHTADIEFCHYLLSIQPDDIPHECDHPHRAAANTSLGCEAMTVPDDAHT